MPSAAAFKLGNGLHRAVVTLTAGRVGWKSRGVTALTLTTTGRRSGRPHTVFLNAFQGVPGAWVVVASRGGDDRDPDWLLNISANPDVTICYGGGRPVAARARAATSVERDSIWPGIKAAHRSYAGYERRTTRVIPLVVLEPVTSV